MELHDEPLAHWLSVPLKIHLCSQSHVVVTVHRVPQPFRLLSVDARSIPSLLQVVHFDVIWHSELESLSLVTCSYQHLESQAL